MALIPKILDFIDEVGTDYKTLRTWLFGSSVSDLSGLATTDKTSIVAAINEVKSSATGSPPPATENKAGVVELASLTAMAAGVDPTRVATVAGVRQETAAVRNDILGGVGPMADTLQELYALAQDAEETAAINDLVTTVGQKANAADVYTKAQPGDVETDLVAAYTAAKA